MVRAVAAAATGGADRSLNRQDQPTEQVRHPGLGPARRPPVGQFRQFEDRIYNHAANRISTLSTQPAEISNTARGVPRTQ